MNRKTTVCPPSRTTTRSLRRITQRLYRHLEHSPFTDVSRRVPVINECRPDGLINPTSCEYLNAWLQF